MFFYQSIPWYSVLMWFAVFGALVLFNELGRANKWTGIAVFIVVPAILTVAVWPCARVERRPRGLRGLRIAKKSKNPLKEEMYGDHAAFQKVVAENS